MHFFWQTCMCPWPPCLGFRQPAAICGPGYEPTCVVHEGEASTDHPLPGHPPKCHHHTGQGQYRKYEQKWQSGCFSQCRASWFLLMSHFVLLSTITYTHHHLSQFFPSGLIYAHNAPYRRFSLSRSFATLFLSWQPLPCGVCVRLFVSVCGYVWKCVRICLWVFGAWVLSEGVSWQVTKCKEEHTFTHGSACVSVFCMSACLPVWMKQNHICLLKSARKSSRQRCPLTLLAFSDWAAPTASCFYLWRQDMGSGVPHWPLASTTSHISPSTSYSKSSGCQLPPKWCFKQLFGGSRSSYCWPRQIKVRSILFNHERWSLIWWFVRHCRKLIVVLLQ